MLKTIWTWLKQHAFQVGGGLALAAMFLYALVLAFFPITFFPILGKFAMPDNAKVDPYLARAITLTFGFLATWLILKYMFGLDVLMRFVGLDWRKKFLAFAGLVAVGILYNLTLWWLTTAEPRKKMSELQEKSEAQSTEIARLTEDAAQNTSVLADAKADGEKARGEAERARQQYEAEEAARKQAEELACQQAEQTAAQLAALDERVVLQEAERAKREEALRAQVASLEQVRKDRGAQDHGDQEDYREALPVPPAPAQEQDPVFQPAVYTAPPAPSAPTPLKPKARVVMHARYVRMGESFHVVLEEFNGVDVDFDSMSISIWKMQGHQENLEDVKSRRPVISNTGSTRLVLKGMSKTAVMPFYVGGLYGKYSRFLLDDEWVEGTLSGTDANGYAHTLTFAGAD